jgi:hypothetical protein
MRLADVLAGLTLFIGCGLFHASLQTMLLFNLALVAFWLVAAARLGREHNRLSTKAAVMRLSPACATQPEHRREAAYDLAA